MDTKNFYLNLILFLVVNFAALTIGGMSTGSGVISDWYLGLNKAPWTPPGWVFGVAWSLIMICFSVYMARAIKWVQNKRLLTILFVVQLILNIVWNPIFFTSQAVILAMIVVGALALLMLFFWIKFKKELKQYSYLLAPYVLWLFIACSLNLYILMNN